MKTRTLLFTFSLLLSAAGMLFPLQKAAAAPVNITVAETEAGSGGQLLHMNSAYADDIETGPYAIGFWFKTHEDANGTLLQLGRQVINKVGNTISGYQDFLITQRHYVALNNNKLSYKVQSASGTVSQNLSGLALQPNTWYYFLLTHDPENEDLVIYLDGIQRLQTDTGDLYSGNIPADGKSVYIELGGSSRTEQTNNGNPTPSEFTPDLDAYFHSFSVWDDVTSEIIEFHHEKVLGFGPEAYEAAIFSPLPNEIKNALLYYAPFNGDANSVSPGTAIPGTNSGPFFSFYEGTSSTTAVFSNDEQEFQTLKRDLNISINHAEALEAYTGFLAPPLNTASVVEGAVIPFRAPAYVYIDRQGQALPVPPGQETPLDSDIRNLAVARWKTVGFTVPGTTISGTDLAADIEVTDDLTFEWQVVKEVALIMESAIPEGLESVSAGNPDPAVQKVWVPEGSGEIATIDGFVFAPDSANDIRYRINGYELQNHPVARAAASGSFLVHPASADPYEGSASFAAQSGNGWTIAFWLRMNDIRSTPSRIFEANNIRLRLGEEGRVQLLRSGGAQITAPGEGTRQDIWNHWAFTYDPADGITTLYLNGRAVGQDAFDFAPSGTWRLGSPDSDFDVDDLRVWSRPLSGSEINKTRQISGGITSSGLVAGYDFNDAPVFDGTDYILSQTNPASSLNMGPVEPSRQAEDRAFFPTELDNSQQVPEIVLNDYTMIRWSWEKEYKIESLTANGGFDPATSISSGDGGVQAGAGALWVREGDSVEILVDTEINNSPLQSLIGLPTGLFENVTLEGETLDAANNPAGLTAAFLSGSNQYRLSTDFVDRPGRILWNFGEPVYVVRVPLGESLDPATGTELDGSPLAPLQLAATFAQPFSVTQLIRETPNDASVDNVIRWDGAGRVLWPVRPGQFLLEWPTADGQQTRLVQIVAGFAGDPYQVSASLSGTFPDVDSAFPGAPHAMYQMLHNAHVEGEQNGEIPLVALDPDASDRFFFNETDGLAYSERIVRDGSTGDVTERSLAGTLLRGGKQLQITETSRSVLVFSVRADPDESATGDLQRESLLVRTVESTPFTEVTINSEDVSIRDGFVARFNGSTSLDIELGSPIIQNSTDGRVPISFDFWAFPEISSTSPEMTLLVLESDTGFDDFRIGFKAGADGGNLFVNCGGQTLEAPQDLTAAGWDHWAVVLSDNRELTLYRNGTLVAGPLTITEPGIRSNMWRIGFDPGTSTGFQGYLDNFRSHIAVLSASALQDLAWKADQPDPTVMINFTFDSPPVSGLTVSNEGSGYLLAYIHAELQNILSADVRDQFYTYGPDSVPEVATRVTSRFDQADYGAPFLIPAVSNYNANLYDRAANPGEWGAFYPVNASDADVAGTATPIGIWYRNDSRENDPERPNVAWPYLSIEYNRIQFPEQGPHRDQRIYIASRIGSEGVDEQGNDQEVFSSAAFTGLSVYNQPDPEQAGWNPNEEHALVAISQRAGIGGVTPTNPAPDAVFALRNDLNRVTGSAYTSEPWVLAEVTDLETGVSTMRAWKVEQTRNEALDAGLNLERRSGLYPSLSYDAENPDGFLQPLEVQPANPSYDFHYAAFAGELLPLPYPLGEVMGAVLPEETTATQLDDRRVFWKDHKGTPWIVSGRTPAAAAAPDVEARFDARFWYPLLSGFWFDLDADGQNDVAYGTAIPWLPTNGVFYRGQDAFEPEPVAVRYEGFWKNDYPVLKTGETLTFAGGEYQADFPLASGLPAVVGWSAAQLVFDSSRPEMDNVIQETDVPESYAARLIRPLDEIRVDLESLPLQLNPANGNVLAQGTDWFFSELSASLQKRVFYDTLTGELVLRGLLNDRAVGDADLTAPPISLYVLEPNVLTQAERQSLRDLDADTDWQTAVDTLYSRSRNPDQLDLDGSPGADITTAYYPGLMRGIDRDEAGNFKFETDSETGLQVLSRDDQVAEPLLSLGTGSALITSPHLLNGTAAAFAEPLYVTLAENNHPSLGAAPVSVHVIRISPRRYRGGVKLVEAPNAFDEKITLRHTADFGGAVENVVFDWHSQEVSGSIPEEAPDQAPSEWFNHTDTAPTLDLAGLPDKLLADQWIYSRYRLSDESGFESDATALQGAVEADWIKDDSSDPAPYQWAGAHNSPQVQSDGSFGYVPALAFGWVKRVLDRINAYEARITDFYNNGSPATYTSMIQQAGTRPLGPVSLSSDKDVIENVGLIALYQTVLDRALTLVEGTVATDGVQQALLLAATRISDFYMLLGNEAYSDALDPTIGLGTGSVEYGNYAPTVWSFQNQEASLLHEELALLRGTDFAKAWPVDNRLFWNFTKGDGEAAYANNYQISDVNADGFINEYDAAELYPQGHGDAWGHYTSSLRTHYRLLQSDSFAWITRSEFYALADNVLEVDYLDESKFAHAAAARARAGSDIVRQTYRQSYTADPAGQWQGYTDTNPDRAWGLQGWSKRAGQGAYFDWLTANALLPAEAPDPVSGQPAENLEDLDRQAVTAPGEIAASLGEIQSVLDDAARGLTPIGVAENAVPFDIDPARLERGQEITASHFEQIYERAVTALQNTVTAFDYANQVDQRIRQVVATTEELTRQAVDQDLAFRNRLKQVFGTPYAGTVGAGQLYPEGYVGPDLFLWLYVDGNNFQSYLPLESEEFIGLIEQDRSDQVSEVPGLLLSVNRVPAASTRLAEFFSSYLEDSFTDFTGYDITNLASALLDFIVDPEQELSLTADFALPITSGDTYGFLAPESWGEREVTGSIQTAILRQVTAQNELAKAVNEYEIFLNELSVDIEVLFLKQETLLVSTETAAELVEAQKKLRSAFMALEISKRAASLATETTDRAADIIVQSLPTVVGTSNDVSSIARSGIFATTLGVSTGFDVLANALEVSQLYAQFDYDIEESEVRVTGESRTLQNDLRAEVQAVQENLNNESSLRYAISSALLSLEEAEQAFLREVDLGTALLEERQTQNRSLAAAVQRERYNDMTLRVTHNDALQKYRHSFDLAAQYAYLAAKAYAFETNLDDSDPANARGALTDIVATRLPGRMTDGHPQMDGDGLAGILARLKINYDTLEGQLGFNNPEAETGRFSLRRELFRVQKFESGDPSQPAVESDRAWRQSLSRHQVANLWDVPEFRTHCRPPWPESDGAQPGIVIPFSSEIFEGRNFFGWPLGGGDQSYDASRFSTKIRSAGVWFEGYDGTNLAVAPRVWLVPAGNDVIRIPDSPDLKTRTWNILDQAIPAPYALTSEDLEDDRFLTSDGTLAEPYAAARQFSRFRAYHDDGDELFANDELIWNSRLAGRSVWNTRWLLIIPGSTLGASPDDALRKLIGSENQQGIRDIRLLFETYSASGN
ncbi:hypothetical protein P0Y35_13270 [Kiritimatiellaeota bacterium B1221]|nr:hypothetical protein [Kiritimatiellaeota bacterium B1221]